MGKKSGGGTTTQTTTQDPWSGIQSQLHQAVSDTQNLYNNGGLNYSYYPGQTIAGPGALTQQVNNLTAQRGLNGSPVTSASQQQITDTLNGKYLDPSTAPGFQQALQDAQKAYSTGTAAQADAAFNRSGAYGGSAYQETKEMQNKAFGDSLNTLAGNFYDKGRTNQLQAAALAPQTANQDYTNLAAAAAVGQNQDDLAQSQINSDIDRYNANQQAPVNAIQNYIGLLNNSGANYGTATSSTPYHTNNAANTLGLLGGVNSLLGGGTGVTPTAQNGAGIAGTAMKAASKMSDIRLKDNISLVGEENGFKIYDFSYISDPNKNMYRGVMAQEVLETRPDAIEKIGDFFAVRYEDIGIEFKKLN